MSDCKNKEKFYEFIIYASYCMILVLIMSLFVTIILLNFIHILIEIFISFSIVFLLSAIFFIFIAFRQLNFKEMFK